MSIKLGNSVSKHFDFTIDSVESMHNCNITSQAPALFSPSPDHNFSNIEIMALSRKLIASFHSSVITRDIHEQHVCIKFIFSCNRINSTTQFLHLLSSRRDDDVFASGKKVFALQARYAEIDYDVAFELCCSTESNE